MRCKLCPSSIIPSRLRLTFATPSNRSPSTRAAELAAKLTLGEIVSAWAAAGENKSVQVKSDAGRVLRSLPPQVAPLVLEAAKELFEKDAETPHARLNVLGSVCVCLPQDKIPRHESTPLG